MTRATLLLFALIVATVAGAVAATRGRRAWEQLALPPRRARPPAVEAALRAWEARREPPATALEGPDPESAADVAFLRAAASGTDGIRLDRALLEMARRHDGRDASARALWTLVERAPDEATRAVRRQAFADRWPEAWTLARSGGSP